MAEAHNEDLMERIPELEDQLSVWEARVAGEWVPWEAVKAAADLGSL